VALSLFLSLPHDRIDLQGHMPKHQGVKRKWPFDLQSFYVVLLKENSKVMMMLMTIDHPLKRNTFI
jgi:hypothetical protein